MAKEECKLGKYGGQAVIEGVMMMGKDEYATAIRKMDGKIEIDKQKHTKFVNRHKYLNIPIMRGFLSFFETMIIGMKCLMFSAEEFEIEEEKAVKAEPTSSARASDTVGNVVPDVPKKDDKSMPEWLLILVVIFSLALSVGLFILLPSFIANIFKLYITKNITNVTFYAVIESILRILIFFIYLLAVSYQSDVRRVFEYHGAEHKTINCLEDGKELTVENVKEYSRFNPRCGTSFLFLIMIISIIVYSIPVFRIRDNILVTFGIRIILLPLIAGISYELIKILGVSTNKIAKAISVPGMWFQNFTTKEPDESQIEVAIAALSAVRHE